MKTIFTAIALSIVSFASTANACDVNYNDAYSMEFSSGEDVMIYSPSIDGDFINGYVCEDGNKLYIKELSSDVRLVKIEY